MNYTEDDVEELAQVIYNDDEERAPLEHREPWGIIHPDVQDEYRSNARAILDHLYGKGRLR